MAHWILRSKDFSYQKLETQFSKTGEVFADAATNRRIMKNDLWLDGEGYIGAPPVMDDPNAQILWQNLKRTFTSENVIQDMVWRVRDSIFGSSSDWKIELSPEARAEAEANNPPKPPKPAPTPPVDPNNPPPANDPNAPPADNPPANNPPTNEPPANDPNVADEEEEAAIDPLVAEADQLLTTYWDESDILETLRDALEDRLVEGRGAVRVYVPARFRNADGSLKTEIKTLADALAIIRVEKVAPENARILDAEGERISLYKGNRIKDYESGETEDVFEFSFVDDAGLTFVGTIARDDNQFMQPATETQPALPINNGVNPLGISAGAQFNQPADASTDAGLIAALKQKRVALSNPLKLGGALTLTVVEGAPYVTEQLRKCNGGVNLNLTMGVHATVESGFSEMATLNAEVEMMEVQDANSPTGKKLVPRAMKRGGNAVQNLVGIRTFNTEKGVEEYTTPQVVYKEPTPMDSFEKGKEIYYKSCLSAGGQRFVLISGEATPSGESRKLAEKDYLRRARPYKRDADKLGGNTISAVLRLAAELIGKSGYFDKLSIKFDAVIDVSVLTADDKRVMLDEIKEGVLSEETYMTRTGTENPTAERATIQREKREKYALQQQYGLTKFPANNANGGGDPQNGNGNNNNGGGAGNLPNNNPAA